MPQHRVGISKYSLAVARSMAEELDKEVMAAFTARCFVAPPNAMRLLPKIEKVIYCPPATVVLWADKTKTVVKVHNEPFDKEKGLAMAIMRKLFGRMGTEKIIKNAQEVDMHKLVAEDSTEKPQDEQKNEKP